MGEVKRPSDGVDYPIVLGNSLLGRPQKTQYTTVRYDFMPASAGRFQAGLCLMQPSNHRVTIQLPNNTTGQCDLEFQGKYEASKDTELECVAIFDGTSFRLELLAGTVKNLKLFQGSSILAGRTAPVVGASPESPPVALNGYEQPEEHTASDDEFEKAMFGSDNDEEEHEENEDIEDGQHKALAKPTEPVCETSKPVPSPVTGTKRPAPVRERLQNGAKGFTVHPKKAAKFEHAEVNRQPPSAPAPHVPAVNRASERKPAPAAVPARVESKAQHPAQPAKRRGVSSGSSGTSTESDSSSSSSSSSSGGSSSDDGEEAQSKPAVEKGLDEVDAWEAYNNDAPSAGTGEVLGGSGAAAEETVEEGGGSAEQKHYVSTSDDDSSSDDEALNRCSDDESDGIGIEHI